MRLSGRYRAVLYGAALCVAVLAVGALAEETRAPARDDLTQSASRGNPSAQYELGVAYANGDGMAVDYAEAAHWFIEAAHNGNADARRQLVFMVQMGLTAPPTDPVSAAGLEDTTFRVQVASVASEADGAREWRRLQRLHPEALGRLNMAVEAFNAPSGDHLFRVEGGPLDEDAARTICGKLRAEGAGCRIVRPGP